MSPIGLFIFLASTSLCITATMADQIPVHVADEDFISKQKMIYELLWHMDQPELVNRDLFDQGKSWDIKKNMKLYKNESIVNKFLEIYDMGMLPRGEIFSVFYPAMLDEAVALYRLFRAAEDFETFHKTAAWARVYINEGQFMYAFSVAVIYRPDTKYMKLPPLYEINPYLFFESDVIRRAHFAKMSCSSDSSKKSYVIMANHSLWYSNSRRDMEQKLNYFMEDIDLSAYYYTLNLELPFWMSGDELGLGKSYRGERYYHILKLILARYNLERLSNDMDEVEELDWNELYTIGYHPFMSFPNGLHFPNREYDSPLPFNKRKLLQELKIFESRILSAIDSGFILDLEGKMESIYTPEGFDFLGNLIQGNADSLNKQLYDSIDCLARNILGYNPDPLSKYQILPSALQYYSTSLRDPAFYRLIKKIVGYFERYKSNIEPYTQKELGYSSGLEIESVVLDKLETYFDHSDIVLDNAVAVGNNEDGLSFKMKVRQYRLNHKPFSYSIGINSENETEAMIRIFLGPKYDPYNMRKLDLFDNYENFYEFDMWRVNLTSGMNMIKRSSHETLFVIPDQEGADIFYEKLRAAEKKIETLTYSEHVYGFPERLLLPKGKRDGLNLQVFVHVIPLNQEEIMEIDSPLWGKASLDGRPLGYPLDRPMLSKNFGLKNMCLKDVFIFHKEASEINASTI